MIDTDKYEGHHICIECGSDEIPVSSTDGGEEGLTDYFFSCAECDFSWYVAVRTDEHEDGASAGASHVGFVDEVGNIHQSAQQFNVRGDPNPAWNGGEEE